MKRITIDGPNVRGSEEVRDSLLPLIHGFLRKKDVLNGQVHQQQSCDHSVVIEGSTARVTHYLGQADAYALRQAIWGSRP